MTRDKRYKKNCKTTNPIASATVYDAGYLQGPIFLSFYSK